VRSRNLENAAVKARYWDLKIQPKWVVMPGKQTATHNSPRSTLFTLTILE
jgi:hypothetical protein